VKERRKNNNLSTSGRNANDAPAPSPQETPAAASPPPDAPNTDNSDPVSTEGPVFAQPQPTPDPTQFRVRHPSDAQAYAQIDALNRTHGAKGEDVIKEITETDGLCSIRLATRGRQGGQKTNLWSPIR
jgi:hypothetical protein